MAKTPFLTKEAAKKIIEKYPTPFHIYDERGIRKNAENLKKLFHGIKDTRNFLPLRQRQIPFL